MTNTHIYLQKGLAFLFSDSSQCLVKIEKIDTAGRSYFLDKAHQWDAVRTTNPVLEPEAVTVYGSDSATQQSISGRVYGYPEAADGRRMETSAITAFHLANGEYVQTEFGKSQTPLYRRILRDVVEGRSPR